MAATRNTYYATIVYPESAPSDWMNILEEQHIQALVSPLHDKDIDKEGNPKKPHYHVVLIFESLKSPKQAQEIFEKISGVGTIPLHSLGAYSRYLCHTDNPEKAQYVKEDVKEIGGANYKECCRQNEDKEKDEVENFMQIADLIGEKNIVFYGDLYKIVRTEYPDLIPTFTKKAYALHALVMSQATKNRMNNRGI